MSKPILWIVIPCYNEELTIKKVILDFKKTLPKADIYVYDNNSTDNSYEIARKILNNLKQMSKGILIFTSKSIDLEVCDEYIILNENGGHNNE